MIKVVDVGELIKQMATLETPPTPESEVVVGRVSGLDTRRQIDTTELTRRRIELAAREAQLAVNKLNNLREEFELNRVKMWEAIGAELKDKMEPNQHYAVNFETGDVYKLVYPEEPISTENAHVLN